jgi:hypothetical protein
MGSTAFSVRNEASANGKAPVRRRHSAALKEPAAFEKPLISPKAKPHTVELRNTFLYDIETKPGGKYVFSGFY